MPRKIIPLVTGQIYHIYNRGVDKRDIFQETGDYQRLYYSLIYFNTDQISQNFRLAKSRYSKDSQRLVDVHAYSLLPNHFHLILTQLKDNGISEYMKRVSAGYTGFFNEKYKRSGSLFQGTFKRIHVEDEEQYRYLFAYVNENHYVHGISRQSGYVYSSSEHFQKINVSHLINIDMAEYHSSEAQKIAEDIYVKRKDFWEALE